MLATKTKYVA